MVSSEANDDGALLRYIADRSPLVDETRNETEKGGVLISRVPIGGLEWVDSGVVGS
jgi:hypothetical protein